MGPSGQPAHSADQGEAADLLDPGQPLWFTLAESTFNRSGVTNTRLRFDLVLPALPEEVTEQVRGILHAVDDIADPYRALKVRLLDLFTPKPPEDHPRRGAQ